MLDLIQKNRWFFIPYFLFLCIGSFLLLRSNKLELMFWFNQHYNPFLDKFFIFLTDIGDGLAYVLVAIILLWFSFRKSIQACLIFAFVSTLSQFLKNFVFPHADRPMAYLLSLNYPIERIRRIPGVQILMAHSFPSGHSITGFSLALILAFWIKEKSWGLAFFSLGLFIAYSRVYLFEHFFLDIFAGSILGVFSTLFLFYGMEKKSWPRKDWESFGLKDLILIKSKP